MVQNISLAISGVKAIMDTYFYFRNSKNNNVEATITINNVIIGASALAINLSVINKSNKPFSIISIALEQQDNFFEACTVIDVKTLRTQSHNAGLCFQAETFDLKHSCECYFDLKPFNKYAYLEENQAETGWILFKIPSEKLIDNKLGIKISGVDERLYANP